MNDFEPDLTVNAVFTLAQAHSKGSVFDGLTRRIATETGLNAGALNYALLSMEQKQPSTIGDGVALIQTRMKGLIAPYITFAWLPRPVKFSENDNDAVDLVCVVLSPEEQAGQHLQSQARLIRRLRDPSIRTAIRGTRKKDLVKALLSTPRRSRKLAA